MLAIIAEKKGFFEQNAVSCKFTPMQTGVIAIDAVHSGDLDFAVAVDVNVAFIWYQGESPARVLCTIQEKTDDAVLARKDRGIRTPDDLKGKTVAYLPATTSHVFLWRFLKSHQIAFDQIDPRKMTPPAMQAAIVNGDIDAASVWQPYRYNAARSLGDDAVVLDDNTLYTVYAPLLTSVRFAEQHAEECSKVLKALMQAEEFLTQNRDQAIAILSPELEMTAEVLDVTWDEYKPRVRLSRELLDTIREEGQWIKATEKDYEGKDVPTYNNLLFPSILQGVAPDRVTLQ